MLDIIKRSFEDKYKVANGDYIMTYAYIMFAIGKLYGEGKITFEESKELMVFNGALMVRYYREAEK